MSFAVRGTIEDEMKEILLRYAIETVLGVENIVVASLIDINGCNRADRGYGYSF